jgi:hypothetical protein
VSQDRLDRIERALETITRQHHEFDMDWTGKMGELTAKIDNGFERLQTALTTLAEQQIVFNDRQLVFEVKLEKLVDHQLESQAGLQALTALIDRFIRGQGGDGQQRTQQP